MNMNDPEIQRALAFATAAHAAINQRRKYTLEPYIVHPIRLAQDALVQPWVTRAAVIALLGHDTVEDTRVFVCAETGVRIEQTADFLKKGGKLVLVEGITIGLWRDMFGNEVADIIDGLTDVAMPWDGNRKTRMAINRDHTWAQPAITQNCKLIDIRDNLRDIAKNDPDFAPKYFSEKREVVEGLTKADPDLRDNVLSLIRDFYEQRRAA